MQNCLRSLAGRRFYSQLHSQRQIFDRADHGTIRLDNGLSFLHTTQCFSGSKDLSKAAKRFARGSALSRGRNQLSAKWKPFRGIPLPAPGERRNVEAWVAALDLALPPQLRGVEAREGDPEPSRRDSLGLQISSFLASSRKELYNDDIDVLLYMGLKQDRWEAIIWIVNQIIEDPHLEHVRLEKEVLFRWSTAKPLQSLVDSPPLKPDTLSISLEPSEHGLADALQKTQHSSGRRPNTRSSALGHVLRSLGSMLVQVAGDSLASERITPHVLHVLAILHHHNFIPHSIYTAEPTIDAHSLHQPALLHTMSSSILSSLADAHWSGQATRYAALDKCYTERYGLFGPKMPGTAGQKSIFPTPGLEVWLDLILWTCLHGPWFEEGLDILCKTRAGASDSAWSLICWTDLFSASSSDDLAFGWLQWLFGPKQNADAKEQRAMVEHTISSEVVAAYIDGLMLPTSVGLQNRAKASSNTLNIIHKFKQMLDSSKLDLGAMSWDAVMVRLLETQSINTIEHPEHLCNIARLASPFAGNLSSTSKPTPNRQVGEKPYIFEYSSAALGLFHRSIESFVQTEDLNSALAALSALQDLTDDNKQRSVAAFFELLRTHSQQEAGSFSSNLSAAATTYPNFFPRIPPNLLAGLLDLATTEGELAFGEWLLKSDDVDGAMIPQELWANAKFAPSIIKYSTRSKDKDLLLHVIKASAKHAHDRGLSMDKSILRAFLHSQIELHRWKSVQSILRSSGTEGLAGAYTTALLVKQMMCLASQSSLEDPALDTPKNILESLIRGVRRFIVPESTRGNAVLQMDSVLALTASMGTGWASLCKPLRSYSSPHDLLMPLEVFRTLLEGVAESRGSSKAVEAWQQWCKPPVSAIRPTPHALPDERRSVRSSAIKRHKSEPHSKKRTPLIIDPFPGREVPYILYGRVDFSLSTVRVVIRKAISEMKALANESERDQAGDRWRQTASWAESILKGAGVTVDNIEKELNPLKS